MKNAFWKLLVIAASCVALAFMTGCPKKDEAKGKDKAAKKKDGDKKGEEPEKKGEEPEKKGGEEKAGADDKGGDDKGADDKGADDKGGDDKGEPEEKKGGDDKGGDAAKGDVDCEKICNKQLECAKAMGGPAAEAAEKAAGACKQGCEMAMKSDNAMVKKQFAMYTHCIDKDCKDMAMCLAEAAKKLAEEGAGTTGADKPKEGEGDGADKPKEGEGDGADKPKEGEGDKKGADAGSVDCEKVCGKQLECAKAAGGPAAEAAEKAAGACKMGCEAAVKSGQEAALKSLKAVSTCADKACGVEFAKCMMEAMK